MNDDILEALQQIEREKDIPMDVLLDTIESALASAYKKNYGVIGEVRVRTDPEGGGFQVYCEKEVVEKVEIPHTEINLYEARQHVPAAKAGDIIEIEVTPGNFSRIAAQTARQVVTQHIREVERKRIHDEYLERVGEILTGIVQRREGRTVLVNIGKVEALMPASEQVPSEPYRFNDRIKVYLLEVRMSPKGPQVIVSRTHPQLIRKLFAIEVPEIAEEVVEIKVVAREPGGRTKIAVASNDERVDPVGSCVGHRGSRVQAVVDELYNEKIDIVRWQDDPARFVAEALSPARVNDVTLNDEDQSALVMVVDTQLSLAIGKSGQNVRLAAKLTGRRLDIRSDSQLAEQEAQAAASAETAQAPEEEALPAEGAAEDVTGEEVGQEEKISEPSACEEAAVPQDDAAEEPEGASASTETPEKAEAEHEAGPVKTTAKKKASKKAPKSKKARKPRKSSKKSDTEDG